MSPRDRATFAEAQELSLKLYRVTDRTRADFSALAAELDLTALAARALLMLAEPRPMRDLAERLACDPSNVTGLADRLEARGVVERVPGRDRRVKLLRLTPEGHDLRDRFTERLAAGATVSATLTAGERADLHRLLDRMLEEG